MSTRSARPPTRAELEPPDARETAIIGVARRMQKDLPEPFVVGRMFFRFDPGFQAEVRAARLSWRGAEVPPARRGWSDVKRFDYEANFTRDKRLRVLAERLASRWGLDTTHVVHALATGRSLNYPYYHIQADLEDPETGLVYTEVRVYSEYVWTRVRSGLLDVEATVAPPIPRRFPDSKQPGARLTGMTSRVASRALALYFLTEDEPGRRPTGGRRRPAVAEDLWREGTPPDRHRGDHWQRAQPRLLAHVARRRRDPVALLMALQQERCLGDEEWARVLGVELAGPNGTPVRDTWHGARSEVAPSRAFWDRVVMSMPELADDLVFDL
jgi:hypothetical protein